MSIIEDMAAAKQEAADQAAAGLDSQIQKFTDQVVRAHFQGTARNKLNVASLTASELAAVKAGVAGKKAPKMEAGDSADTISVCVARCKELGIAVG
jgi:hypothetical protein